MKFYSSVHGTQKLWQAMGLLIFVCSAIIACGGGGGSGSPTPTVQYTGVTTPAALTTETASTLVGESYQGAMTSDSMVPFAAMASAGQGNDDTPLSAPIAVDMQAAFADSLYQAIHASQEAQVSTAERAVSESSTIDGDCGGSATYNVTYDENSGIFSGSFVYNGFCSEAINLSGQATFTGRMDVNGGVFDYFSLTFTNLTTTADGQSNTVNGTLECDFQGSDFIITTNMVVAQSSSGLVCWLNNYTVQIAGSQMEISGRYYSPIHGYIDFVTTSPLIISSPGQFPSAGVIAFTGAVGTGGLQTTAQLTALSSTTCQVTADTDGDGVDDFDTGEILWTEL